MSFQDIERGLSTTQSHSTPGLPTSPQDVAFRNLQQSLSLQVFKINSNVQGILKLVDQLGTPRDTAAVRKGLHDLTESTRDMVKRGTDDLKKLAGIQASLPQYKTHLQKTSHDLQLSLVAFQQAQKASAERQRTVVLDTKHAVEEEEAERGQVSSTPRQQQQQQQLLQQQLSPADLAYQESLIHEREQEIREIETGIHELNEIFRDLGTLVVEQGSMIDNIESNLTSVAVNTAGASEELTVASDYQRKAGRRAACLGIVLVIVTCVVLLAVRIALLVIVPFPW
ncbi:hypothetical protein M407DRAFT_243993 [Tulasnella calospora MUT 4182]|uniref:t-SNARE coiled-coil homology domain-containing protein n=1 Tax=Tulasnella calospora MUT 4182 TaxID=1051891 RepID=A0A0C3KW74_9AGAM|nr:hypothetical protein M407DRAFT_243993 [Tulasnella calospora MUT 4182]